MSSCCSLTSSEAVVSRRRGAHFGRVVKVTVWVLFYLVLIAFEILSISWGS
jgi:hypothetical protein